MHRDPDAKILTIHRLVQLVLRDKMDRETQGLWSERAVKAMSKVFPGAEFERWGVLLILSPVLLQRYNRLRIYRAIRRMRKKHAHI